MSFASASAAAAASLDAWLLERTPMCKLRDERDKREAEWWANAGTLVDAGPTFDECVAAVRVQAHFRGRQLRATGPMPGVYGLAFDGDCSSVLGTNNAPFSKYPGATGLWRVRNTGTEPWPPGGIILHPDGGPGLQVPPSLPEPVLSGEEAVVGVAWSDSADSATSALVSALRDEPAKLKAARQSRVEGFLARARTRCLVWWTRRCRPAWPRRRGSCQLCVRVV